MIALWTTTLRPLIQHILHPGSSHKYSMDQLRTLFTDPIRGTQDHRARAFRFMVDNAQTADDLWHLRSRAYLMVSEHGGQQQAQQFLRNVDSALSDWLPRQRFVRPALAG